jgi:basic membrane protein A
MKFSKVFVVLMVGVMVSLAAFGCAPAAPAATTAPAAVPTQAAPAANTGKQLKVGLIHPSPITDSWSGIGYAAEKKMQSDLGAQISEIEVADPSGYEKAFSDYASQGYNFVIGFGEQYQDAAAKVSPQFPNTFFTTVGGSKNTANYAPIDANDGYAQSLYALCAMAGKISKTHKATGFIIEMPATRIPIQGCQQGFESISGNKFNIVVLNDQNDVGAAKEAAIQAMSNGADILIANANLAGNGVLQAVAENGGDKVFAIGTISDESSAAPKNVLVSGELNYTAALLTMAKSVKDGTITGAKPYKIFLTDQDVYPFAYNPGTASVVTAEMKAFVDDTVKKIQSGAITVKY